MLLHIGPAGEAGYGQPAVVDGGDNGAQSRGSGGVAPAGQNQILLGGLRPVDVFEVELYFGCGDRPAVKRAAEHLLRESPDHGPPDRKHAAEIFRGIVFSFQQELPEPEEQMPGRPRGGQGLGKQAGVGPRGGRQGVKTGGVLGKKVCLLREFNIDQPDVPGGIEPEVCPDEVAVGPAFDRRGASQSGIQTGENHFTEQAAFGLAENR